MNLSEIYLLPTTEKRRLLLSAEGLTQLRNWVSEGLSLCQIARMLQMSSTTLSDWRRYPEIGEIIGHPKPQQPDLSRPPNYRLICGLDYYNRGTILEEYGTAEELWQTSFIHRYFKSFGVSESAYYTDYLEKVLNGNIYRLSNTFSLCYCEINRKGIIKPLKTTYN